MAAAVLAVAVSCKKEKPVLGVSIDPTVLTFSADGGSQTVKVTSSDNWTLSVPTDAQQWLQVSQLSGSGSVNLTITVPENPGKPRAVTVNFVSGMFTQPLPISQEGKQKASDGLTPETAFSASEAYAWVMANITGDNTPSPEKMYVKGFIHKIVTYKDVEQYYANNDYGNASFYMSDNKEYTSGEKDFEAYQIYYLGNRKFKKGTDKDIAVGDEVIICGHLTKYKETAETMGQGDGYLYSLNGVTEETPPQSEITDATVADFIKSDGNTYYRLTGKVSGFSKGTNSQNKNYMQFNLTDATGTILVYGFKDGQYDKWADKIKDGGTVVVTGTYEFYEKKSQHEVMNTTVESFEEGQAQTEFEQVTVAEFIKKADPTVQYRLAGIVEEYAITDANKGYLSFNLTDETGSILVYSLVEGQFAEWSAKIKDGGYIVLRGSYKLYNNVPEVVNATIESFEENSNYKFCRVKPTTITAKREATSATIAITSNAAWTISSDNEEFTADPASGTGDATVTLLFPANTAEQSRTVTYTVACLEAELEIPVTVTQEGLADAANHTVSVVVAAADGAQVSVSDAIVAAVSTKGFVITDGNANVYVYQNGTPAVSVGDKVDVDATKTTYYELPELTDPSVLVTSNGNEVPRTAAVDINAATIDGYTSTACDYLEITGKLVKDGNFWNVTMDGATRYASADNLPTSIDPSALEGQQVKMRGYFNTLHSKGFLKVVVTEIIPADDNVKYLTVNPTELKAGASETQASFSISSNVAWTAVSDNAAFTLSQTEGNGNATITVTFAANEAEAARTAKFTVSSPDVDGNKVVTLTQAAKPAAGTGVITWDKDKLAAAKDGGVENKMDDVISFTNNSSYSGAVTEMRVYKGKDFVVTAASGYKITKISISCSANGTTKYGPGCWGAGAPTNYTYDGKAGTWTGEQQSVSFNATDNQVRIEELTVEYKAN